MRKLLSVFVAGAFALTLGACSERATAPAVNAKKGSNGDIIATATLRAQKSYAAQEANDFRIGEKVGTLYIRDDGSSTVVFKGTARGLAPSSFRYLSLFYDQTSPVKGKEGCEPGAASGVEFNPLDITGPQMLAAFWTVDENGVGTPRDLEGQYIPVDKIGTVSIRDLTVKQPPNTDAGFGPDAVVACGPVTRAPAN